MGNTGEGENIFRLFAGELRRVSAVVMKIEFTKKTSVFFEEEFSNL